MGMMNEERAGFEDWFEREAHDSWEVSKSACLAAWQAGAAWQSAQGAVPEGYALVSVELLERIDRFYMDGMSIYGELEELRALLAAAPAHPAERLARLAAQWRTVALGSSGQWATPGTAAWWKRMAEAMAAICDDHGRPLCRLHGLRMLDPAVFSRLPLASADSTNAAVNGGSVSRFGMYVPPTAGQRAQVIADRIEQHNSAHLWVPETQIEMQL